jgi:hypothetical protein
MGGLSVSGWIRKNRQLTSLDLSGNLLGAKACCSIISASMGQESRTLISLDIMHCLPASALSGKGRYVGDKYFSELPEMEGHVKILEIDVDVAHRNVVRQQMELELAEVRYISVQICFHL